MTEAFDLKKLQRAFDDGCVAIRAVRRLQPVGGPGDKVFPPSYGVDDRAPHKYATEKRRIGGAEVETVVLDSVQSQANRLELALLEAWRRREIAIPVVTVDFKDIAGLDDLGQVTSLDAPHRLADAILRDSVTKQGTPFRLSAEGKAFAEARQSNAGALYRLCPTALVFGIWDSTGPRGGLGAKFQRALVSEIVGVGAILGRKTSSRIDPAQIQKLEIYEDLKGEWTANQAEARTERGKPVAFGDGKPSVINHGNVTPTIDERAGGVTIDYATHSSVLSLVALRRLRFREDSEGRPLPAETGRQSEDAARIVLGALGLAAITYGQDAGYDLRSRCLLVPEEPRTFEVVAADGGEPQRLTLTAQGAAKLLEQAVAAAEKVGMGWPKGLAEPVLTLRPSPRLVDLIQRSRALTSTES